MHHDTLSIASATMGRWICQGRSVVSDKSVASKELVFGVCTRLGSTRVLEYHPIRIRLRDGATLMAKRLTVCDNASATIHW